MDIKTIDYPHIEWSMERGEPVTIREVTTHEVLNTVVLTHELTENFVVSWIELNGMPGKLISNPFSDGG